jgi:hypothetical protein
MMQIIVKKCGQLPKYFKLGHFADIVTPDSFGTQKGLGVNVDGISFVNQGWKT